MDGRKIQMDMENLSKELKIQLNKCNIYMLNNLQQLNTQSLNLFCHEFLQFTEKLRQFLLLLQHQQKQHQENYHYNSWYLEQKDYIILSLMQVTTCIRYLEYCIKLEVDNQCIIKLAREHFSERLRWCLKAFEISIANLLTNYYNTDHHDGEEQQPQQQQTYDILMDLILDQLENFTCYHGIDDINSNSKSNSNVMANFNSMASCNDAALNFPNHINIHSQKDLLNISQNVRNWINLLIGHVLAFGNVALQQDRNALSVLSQKVIRDCINWQELCELNVSGVWPLNESEFKLKAICLENALYNLDNYVNECLLRAIYVSFIDFDIHSMENLQILIRSVNGDRHVSNKADCNADSIPDETILDDFIADFDVNLDRIHQIGLFAIAFTTNRTMKTIIRNCLASFESLDSILIPAILSKDNHHHFYVKLLIQHYNEEVSIFKKSIYQIINSQQFIECYYENVNNILQQIDKEYNYTSLKMLTQMGKILREQQQHQQVQNLQQSYKEIFTKFQMILNECQTVINIVKDKGNRMVLIADRANNIESILDKKCIVKRFKILRSILHKVLNEFDKNHDNDAQNYRDINDDQDSVAAITNENFNDHNNVDERENISILLNVCSMTTKSSIFYEHHNNNNRQEHKVNKKKFDERLIKNDEKFSSIVTNSNVFMGNGVVRKTLNMTDKQFVKAKMAKQHNSQCNNRWRLRRKDSLRSALFKNQNTLKIRNVFNETFMENTSGSLLDSLHITEILNDLSSSASGMEFSKKK